MNSELDSRLSPRIKAVVRSILIMMTFGVILGIGFVAGLMIPSPNPPWNHLQPLASPSGKYILTVPIEKDQGMNSGMWRVTISDLASNELYKDRDSEFVGYLMSYWVWDSHDRVWLYNSDSGGVYYWEQVEGRWDKHEWGSACGREVNKNEGAAYEPPATLFPIDMITP